MEIVLTPVYVYKEQNKNKTKKKHEPLQKQMLLTTNRTTFLRGNHNTEPNTCSYML